jgi:hypothetical protein
MAQMSATESTAHLELKYLAFAWAQEMGFRCAALEVHVPFSNFRADAAACRPQSSRAEFPGETAIFECKQSRTDLLRDSASSAPALARLAHLHVRRIHLERLLGSHYPTLACGESLFPEFQSFDFSTIHHQGYSKTVREIRQLQARVLKRIKFERLLKYPCANFHYLVVNESLLSAHEWPHGWGILERRNGELILRCPPIRQEPSNAARLALLQRIALAGTRVWKKRLEYIVRAENNQSKTTSPHLRRQ